MPDEQVKLIMINFLVTRLARQTEHSGRGTNFLASYLGHGVVVDVDDLVEVARHHLGHLLQLLEVVRLVVGDEAVQRDRGQVTYGHLAGRREVTHSCRASQMKLCPLVAFGGIATTWGR